MENARSTLVGVKLEQNEGDEKWKGTLAAPNGSIYGIPFDARRVMKLDPVDKSITHIGPDLGDELKWCDGAITDSGVIYCVPIDDRGILKMEKNMVKHPEQLGCIFRPSDDILTETNFDRAVTKFGYKKVLKELKSCIPPADEVCAISNHYPFVLAASYRNSDISVIYQLLRLAPSDLY